MTYQAENPLLATIKIPGAKFQLPSQGLFYDKGELTSDVVNGELYVDPMTSYDEIVLKTPDLLLDGQAIITVFKRCIPQVTNPLELLARDVDFLLICLRIISHGNEVRITHTHECNESKINTNPDFKDKLEFKSADYTVLIDDFIAKTKQIDATLINQQFIYTTEKNIQVHITPIRYKTLIEVLTEDTQKDIENLTPDEFAKYVFEKTTRQLSELINKIVIPETRENLTEYVEYDPLIIHQWLKQQTPKVIREINKLVETTSSWGPELIYDVPCKFCKKTMKLEVPMNPIRFFI